MWQLVSLETLIDCPWHVAQFEDLIEILLLILLSLVIFLDLFQVDSFPHCRLKICQSFRALFILTTQCFKVATYREDFVMGLTEKRILVLIGEFIRLELCFQSADLIAHLSLFIA